MRKGSFKTGTNGGKIDAKNIELTLAARQRWWLIGALSLAALIAVLLFIIYRNRHKAALVLDEKNAALNQLNAALEEANLTKAKLFGIIGHDLRSPINQVYQFLKLQQLRPGLLDDQQKASLNEKIQTATGSLLETMEDLLLWSKTQMNEFSVRPQQTNLSEIVQHATNLLLLNTEAKNINLEVTISPAIEVFTDPYYLQTIVRNLLQNAVKAAPNAGSVLIDATREKDTYYLHICNEGPIFSQEDYEQRLAADASSGSLHGLGLKLVDELCKKSSIQLQFSQREQFTVASLALPGLPSHA